MASDESDDGFDPQQGHHVSHHGHAPQGQTLSRLSVCSSSFTCGNDEEGEEDDDREDGFFGDMEMYMSRLSIENFDADEELSEEEDRGKPAAAVVVMTSDSDGERECYSLPATPPRRRRGLTPAVKEYASENEAKAKVVGAEKPRKIARRRATRGSGTGPRDDWYWNGASGGESEGGGCGVMVITRPKGGGRSLCMDLEEVKACRDLGFELEHERMLEVPTSRLSASGSNLDTNSSGGNSPIGNWRISSPGDDPRDVKARLKVWAQAVALVSASHTASSTPQHSN